MKQQLNLYIHWTVCFSFLLHSILQRSLWKEIRDRRCLLHGRRRQVGRFRRRNLRKANDSCWQPWPSPTTQTTSTYGLLQDHARFRYRIEVGLRIWDLRKVARRHRIIGRWPWGSAANFLLRWRRGFAWFGHVHLESASQWWIRRTSSQTFTVKAAKRQKSTTSVTAQQSRTTAASTR